MDIEQLKADAELKEMILRTKQETYKSLEDSGALKETMDHAWRECARAWVDAVRAGDAYVRAAGLPLW
jgi:hypothetical protein